MMNRTPVSNGDQTVRQPPIGWITPSQPAGPRLAYGLDEAATLASVSREVIRRAIHASDGSYLRARRVGRKFLIMHDDLVRWLESLPDV